MATTNERAMIHLSSDNCGTILLLFVIKMCIHICKFKKKMRNTTPLPSLPSSRHHPHILIQLLPETVETYGGLNRYVECGPMLKSPCRVIHSVVCLTTGPYPLP
jgi:hypothetical protein